MQKKVHVSHLEKHKIKRNKSKNVLSSKSYSLIPFFFLFPHPPNSFFLFITFFLGYDQQKPVSSNFYHHLHHISQPCITI